MINYGMIGFGSFAERTIAPAFLKTRFSKLIALQKRDPETAKKVAGQWSCQAYTDPAELVKDPGIQAVFIAGVNSTRCADTILAAEAGKHVLTEKPMAMDAAECRRMIDVCRANNVKLMVAHMVRFSPAIRKIRDMVKSGRCGNIIAARAEFVFPATAAQRTWFFDRRLAGGGPIFDIGVHCIDTLRFVLDDDVVTVRSVVQPQPTELVTESSGVIALQFRSLVLANVTVSFVSGVRRTTLEIMGTHGMITCHGFSWIQYSPVITLTTADNPDEPVTEEFIIPVGNLYADEIDDFSQCIMNDSIPSVPGEEGLKNQLILDAAMKGGGELSPI
jgi:1,5-anhydro-D-fructose reductase (1,5-anhydro-D-mannitol-forming)